jgi:hypothetical protein
MWMITHVQDDADMLYIFPIFLSVVSWMAVVQFCNQVCALCILSECITLFRYWILWLAVPVPWFCLNNTTY